MEKDKDGIGGMKPGGGGKPQPFGEDGRYGEKSSRERLRDALQNFAGNRGKVNAGAGRKPVPTAVGFARRDTKSHKDHAKEMGLNQREYEREAVRFFNSNQGNLYFDKKAERYYRYDLKSRKVAICDKDGDIRSFYIAKKDWFSTKQELEHV